ncbi:hypothetical protein STAQ_30550 [Allostella sp. ATCC 35155]|nr:hypothetical protein STAQ_30550 [Stella sp. ATCC 35155]
MRLAIRVTSLASGVAAASVAGAAAGVVSARAPVEIVAATMRAAAKRPPADMCIRTRIPSEAPPSDEFIVVADWAYVPRGLTRRVGVASRGSSGQWCRG